MRAAVIYSHGGPDKLILTDGHPDPLAGAGDVVIRVLATGLNYHDVFTRRGMPGIKVPLPMIMGIDIVGEIIELGPDVSEFAVGDRVLVDPINRRTGGLIGEMWPGGLAEYCRVPTHQLMVLPSGILPTDAVALPVAYGTGHRMMMTRGQLKPGEKVLILGASGGVGSCCVQLARLAGAEIVACASSDDKLDRLRKLGADHLINYREYDFVEQTYALFGKPKRYRESGGVDVVVNFTGGDTWVPSMKCLRRDGRLLTCGATAGFNPKTDIRHISSFELNIIGSNGWMRNDLLSLLTLVKDARLKPEIDRIFPLAQVHDAFHRLESRQMSGKILIAP